MQEATQTETAAPTHTTAAKRLFEVLVAVKAHGGTNLYTIVPDVLGITGSTSIATSNAIWDAIRAQRLVANMIEDFQRELREAAFTPDQQQFYSRCLRGILNTFSPLNMAAAAVDGKRQITDVDLNQLENVDMVVKERISEKLLDKSVLAELLTSVEEALAVLDGSGLPDLLRRFIEAQLLKVKAAIAEYKFRGMRGVEEALAGFMGAYDAGRVEQLETVDSQSKLTLKKVLETGQSLVTLARGVVWVYPHLIAGVHEVAKLLS